MHKLVATALLAMSGVLAFAAPASADSLGPIDFEPFGYAPGNINGQEGWIKTGPFDVEPGHQLHPAVVDLSENGVLGDLAVG